MSQPLRPKSLGFARVDYAACARGQRPLFMGKKLGLHYATRYASTNLNYLPFGLILARDLFLSCQA